MISSFASILVVVTSSICEALQQIPQQHRSSMTIPRDMKDYNSNIRATTKQSVHSFQQTSVSPLALSSMMPPQHRVYGRRRNRRQRFMIGDVMIPTSISKTAVVAKTDLFCSAINPDDAVPMGNFQMKKSESASRLTASWREKLLHFSTIASIVCIIDCTLLPILTIMLPLLGMVSAVNTVLPLNHLLHHYGHMMTIYFVLPIGFFATSTNYLYNHRKKWITAIGWFGLALILAANSGTGGGCSMVERVHAHADTATAQASLSLWPGMSQLALSILNTIQHGLFHRITNISGCALLIVSNYISHQHQKKHVHGKDCCAASPP